MIYTTEELNRTTGDLRIIDLGNWVTVTELGKRYGLGAKKIRSVLHHLGMLKSESGRFRLTTRAVQLGLGKRHDKPKKHQYPFDVISPLGQKVIAQNLGWVMEDMDEEKQSKPQLQAASQALKTFKDQRQSQMTTQMEVCWMRDHFPDFTQDEIAGLIDAPQSLVNRYAKTQAKQRDFHQRRKAAG
ncbi:hypothetical protein ILT44_22110 [Microvirga sp. BT689]|uniref:hypothetical protein n=1 Tax=Microvirga arvi TaxID=2778731 RepID=UPI00194FBB74|nr:hypothetical protein [Microvirga arvi]MBM6582904.1 hypothetical protein [Microvirga arvi]